MSLSADQKVNMSLDDISKANKKAAPKKKAAVKPKGAAAKVKPSTGKKMGAKRQNSKMAIEEKTPKKAIKAFTKADKSVGGAKAKRDAAIAKKRGLNATGKATKADVKAAVKKVAAKGRAAKAITKSAAVQPPKKKAITKAAAAQPLKISFKPADLGKTTERNVQMQIKAVLSKGQWAAANKPAISILQSAKNNNIKKALPKPKSKVILR